MSATTELFDRSTHVNAEFVLWEILKVLFPDFDDGLGSSTSTTYFLSAGPKLTVIGTMKTTPKSIEITRLER